MFAIDSAAVPRAAFSALLARAGLVAGEKLQLPERLARVNALLDAAPGPVREAILLTFLDRLTRPAQPDSSDSP